MNRQKWMDGHPSSSPLGLDDSEVCPTTSQRSGGLESQTPSGVTCPIMHPVLASFPGLPRLLTVGAQGFLRANKNHLVVLNPRLRVCLWESPAEDSGHVRVCRDGGWRPEPRGIWVADSLTSPWKPGDPQPPLISARVDVGCNCLLIRLRLREGRHTVFQHWHRAVPSECPVLADPSGFCLRYDGGYRVPCPAAAGRLGIRHLAALSPQLVR